MDDRASLLDREVAVLAKRLRLWTFQRWRATAPPYEKRSDAAFHLAERFAQLAGARVPLPRYEDHVIPDQIAVTGHDVAASASEDIVDQALTELRRTRELLGIS